MADINPGTSLATRAWGWARGLFYHAALPADPADLQQQRSHTDLTVIVETSDNNAPETSGYPSSSDSGVRKSGLRGWVITSLDLLNKGLVEFTACMMFHFIGSVSPTPATNGLALVALVYYAAKISGAHLNPAVTLTFTLLGHTSPLEALVYASSQVCGCVVGALWISALVPTLSIQASDDGPAEDYMALSGCFTPDPHLTPTQVFAWEAVCTACFIVPIFAVVWYTQHKKGYGNTGPLIVGMSLAANAFACGRFTGAALNPARAVGSAVVFDCPYGAKTYVYVLGELAGAAAATAAIAPWYGISKVAWYASFVPRWAVTATKGNHKSIVLETLGDSELPPTFVKMSSRLPPTPTQLHSRTAGAIDKSTKSCSSNVRFEQFGGLMAADSPRFSA